MYEFLDRRTDVIAEPYRLLLSAIRIWVRASIEGRCHCARLKLEFAGADASDALPDFSIAMVALSRDATHKLRFGTPGHPMITDDEARILTLFKIAATDSTASVNRVAAGLVTAEAVGVLRTSAELVAYHLAQRVVAERDQ
jgi:hypothetical protein